QVAGGSRDDFLEPRAQPRRVLLEYAAVAGIGAKRSRGRVRRRGGGWRRRMALRVERVQLGDERVEIGAIGHLPIHQRFVEESCEGRNLAEHGDEGRIELRVARERRRQLTPGEELAVFQVLARAVIPWKSVRHALQPLTL